ncbi:cilia- and flagella-associated protein 221-like isoform X2 [Styela clava]
MEALLSPISIADDWNKNLTLDDLISPKKKLPVPNHLLDTKIFSKLKQNALVKVDPSVVHFEGYDLHKTQRRSIKICNSSSERQNLHIISPSTKYFTVKYTKPRRFVPGFTIDVVIQFTPDEWRYYYDCIRLHCEGEENIVIPLHAYPVMDLSGFPKKLIFDTANSKLGETRRKLLPLRSPCPVDFEYQITVLQAHPALSVHPMSGTVPGEGNASISVLYTPTEYVTSHMTIQLNISQFNSKPVTCFVTASCTPKTNKPRKSIKDLDEVYRKTKIFDPHSLSLVQLSRRRKTAKYSHIPQPTEIEYEGLHFPVKLNTQHAVNSVLMQKAGKLRAKDVREVATSKLALKSTSESSLGLAQSSSRQMKEATFKQDLRKDEIEERANHLRWQVHLGHKALDEETRLEILRERENAQSDYKYKRRCEPDEDNEVLRTSTFKAFRRTFRQAVTIPEGNPSFDLYKNNPWLNRHKALERFQQAARTILIRKRADKKVKMLRQMIENFKSGNIDAQKSVENAEGFQLDVRNPSTPGTPAHNSTPEPVFILTANKVKPFTFPLYVPEDTKDDIATDTLGETETSGTPIEVIKGTPFHNLKVPKQYDICGYLFSDVNDASRSYVSPVLARPLRSGAEDEVIELSVPPHLLKSDKTKTDDDGISSSSISDVSSSQNLENESLTQKDIKMKDRPTSSSSGLTMPSGLLSNPPYHPLHIFNPFPGMQRTYLPFSHSEVDPEYHLCPMPKYTMLPGAQSYLDKDDTIKGIMAWKSLPPQALVSLSQSGTQHDVSLPRWSDPFSEAMVPVVTPTLLPSSLQPQDSDAGEDIAFDSSDPIELTPDMIRAEFTVDENAVNASAAEEDDFEQKNTELSSPKSNYDQLGLKIRNTLKKLENMDKKMPKITYC